MSTNITPQVEAARKNVVDVTGIKLMVVTDRILPEGQVEGHPGIFQIEKAFSMPTGHRYEVWTSPTVLFQITEKIQAIADEYESSQVVLDSDFSDYDEHAEVGEILFAQRDCF